jgi:dienelactone hydrolase
VASFHDVLTPPDWVGADRITAKVIAYHGWDDPYATPDEMLGLGRELSAHRADWQIHAFGDTMHAFTAPAANNPGA